ncbi:hypothetical protein BDN72DRAFT_966192 [Pluteus cervinus]|uniref:Uncharacterized protein n=1 Tax=Pluteus cervinus TaxID=181527 RepID=A0ACD3A263_9AGAR|nr:hypothetical protein BDN72DRAFT_966192 [Pluteus cervinus]
MATRNQLKRTREQREAELSASYAAFLEANPYQRRARSASPQPRATRPRHEIQAAEPAFEQQQHDFGGSSHQQDDPARNAGSPVQGTSGARGALIQPIQQPRQVQPQAMAPTPLSIKQASIGLNSAIPDIKTMAQFTSALQTAKLDTSGMLEGDIERLQNPTKDDFEVLKDNDFIFSLRSFIATTNAAKNVYDSFKVAAELHNPETDFWSFEKVKSKIEWLSGVVPIEQHMCPDSCIAYTGPYSGLDHCPFCDLPRYKDEESKLPHRTFSTIPLGPVLQSLYKSPEMAKNMDHRAKQTCEILKKRQEMHEVDPFDDVYCGSDYLDAVEAGLIKDDDIVFQFSVDGAQLLEHKQSDCWVYIFVNLNLPPTLRYKKDFVIPGAIIPGPKKPKDLASFLNTGLHHISAIQKEGLKIWRSDTSQVKIARPIAMIIGADGPAMADVAGKCGHFGMCGCRVECTMQGRRRDGDTHYYPVMLKPNNYSVPGCSHEDVTFAKLRQHELDGRAIYWTNLQRVANSANPTRYAENRRDTGITRPSIFSGLPLSLGVPKVFVVDMMHLIALNDPDLLLSLWRGTINHYGQDNPRTWEWRVLTDEIWPIHGKMVELCGSYLPSSFGHAPRNIAEKLNSGYRAWEFLIYLFGLAPALLLGVLPDKYWRNYCHLVRGLRLLSQYSISADQLKEAHRHICQFIRDFELYYYQRRAERIHFVRASIHLLYHLSSETIRMGPPAYYAQWTMENTIGNLTREIRQDYDPYTNLSNRGILRAQVTSLDLKNPDLNLRSKPQPTRVMPTISLENGCTLLHPRDTVLRHLTEIEIQALRLYWNNHPDWPNFENWPKAIKRWGRLRLPNQQIVRSSWAEDRLTRSVRRARIAKVQTGDTEPEFAEVRFYFQIKFGTTHFTLAMGSFFSEPDPTILSNSHSVVHCAKFRGDEGARVFDISDIVSLVAMVPFFRLTDSNAVNPTLAQRIEHPHNQFFLVEKPGLDVIQYQMDPEADEEYDENDIDAGE